MIPLFVDTKNCAQVVSFSFLIVYMVCVNYGTSIYFIDRNETT